MCFYRKRFYLLLFVCGLFAGSVLTGYAQTQRQAPAVEQFRVQHFTMADGLPSNRVTTIVEDALGFIWLATWGGGLVRYDGYTFEIFLPRQGDSTSIGSSQITAVHVDAEGNLWTGGGWADPGGLSRFNHETQRFRRYRHDPNDPKSLLNDQVTSIVSSPDDPGIVWVGSFHYPTGEPGGVSRMDVSTGTFTHYTREDGLADTFILGMLIDRDRMLWVQTRSGLNRFNPTTTNFETFSPQSEHAPDFGGVLFGSVFEDGEGLLWVGSRDGGLFRFDPPPRTQTGEPRETGVWTSFLPNPSDPPHPSNSVLAVLEDRAGTFWIGTDDGLYTFDRVGERFTRLPNQPPGSSIQGLYEDRFGVLWAGGRTGLLKVERQLNPFTIYRHHPEDPNSLALGIFEDRAGVLWIGTSGGLSRVDREPGTPGSSPGQVVTRFQHNAPSIYEDRRGTLWIGVSCDGLLLRRINTNGTERFIRYEHDPDNPSSISAGCFNHMLEDQAGNFWMALWSGGLDRLDREAETFTHYTPTSHGLGSDRVLRLYEAPSELGILWVGTAAGLSRFETGAEHFTNFNIGPSVMMLEDRQGRFWVATWGNGLYLFDRQTGHIAETYTTHDGLANNWVHSLFEDDQGFLWLSTNYGLSKFDPETKTFRNYYEQDGLPSNTFTEHAKHQSRSGELFFGGPNGTVSFFPEDLVDEAMPPELVLTGLRIDETPVEIGPDSPLKTSMMVTDAVNLSHSQNDLTFAYVGLQFIDPSENQYRYRLEGYDADWIEVGEQRTARYTNLDPGAYVFSVSARNGDSPWSEAASVRATIQPPWWQTWWAYLFYGLSFVAGVFAVDRFQRRRLLAREREKARERELEQARALEKAHTELQQSHQHLKTTQAQLIQQEKLASLGQLTAGIAHEIKNPLNFVNNFAELNGDLLRELREALAKGERVGDLLSDLEQNEAQVAKHGKRADGIVHAMMQHASGSTGQREPVDINQLVTEHTDLAYHGKRAQMPELQVEIVRDLDAGAGLVEVVPQEIGRVLLNLLGNAFDAVQGMEDPKVTVRTRRINGQVEIRVSDNGPGIPAEIREKIFEPFFTTKPAGSGTGLGLSISYDIITQGHGGTLTVESTKPAPATRAQATDASKAGSQGATFIVTLPLKRRSNSSYDG